MAAFTGSCQWDGGGGRGLSFLSGLAQSAFQDGGCLSSGYRESNPATQGRGAEPTCNLPLHSNGRAATGQSQLSGRRNQPHFQQEKPHACSEVGGMLGRHH